MADTGFPGSPDERRTSVLSICLLIFSATARAAALSAPERIAKNSFPPYRTKVSAV